MVWGDRRLQFGDYRSCFVSGPYFSTNKHGEFWENIESSEPGAASSCFPFRSKMHIILKVFLATIQALNIIIAAAGTDLT